MNLIYKEKCQVLQGELKSQRVELSEKSSEITKLQDLNFKLHQQVDSKTNDVARLSEEKSELEDLVNEHERTAEEHDQATERLRSELISQKNKITDLHETVEKFQSENHDLIEKQKSRRLENLEKQSRIDQLEKKSLNDEDTIAFLKGEITRLEKSKTDLKNQVDLMKKDSMQALAEVTKNLEELQKTNQRIQRENSSLQNQIDKLEKTYDSQVESAESLQTELNQAKENNLKLTNQLKDQKSLIEELKHQKNDQERENEELLNDNQGLVSYLNEFKRKNSDLKKEIKKYQFEQNKKIISETSKTQERLQGSENNSKDSATNTGLNTTPVPKSPPNKINIAPPSLPLTPGTTGTITEHVQVVPVAIDSEKITNENKIPDASNEEPTNHIKADSGIENGIEKCTDGTNTIDLIDVAPDYNYSYNSQNYGASILPNANASESDSDGELIEEALSIESTDSDLTSSNSNGTVDMGVKPKFDFNNSNSKVPELNVNDELVIPESESIAEMPKTSKNVLRRRQSAPVNQEPPTSSARSLRPKRSIRNESFNFLSLKC